jgi:DNA polymerase III alpha subunit
MEKFAEYGFNKSHSAAYGLITIQTAWLKAHYPVEFMAALLTQREGQHRQGGGPHRRARGQRATRCFRRT